jgi:hypothetical protein
MLRHCSNLHRDICQNLLEGTNHCVGSPKHCYGSSWNCFDSQAAIYLWRSRSIQYGNVSCIQVLNDLEEL